MLSEIRESYIIFKSVRLHGQPVTRLHKNVKIG